MILTVLVYVIAVFFVCLASINLITSVCSILPEKKRKNFVPNVSVIVRSWNDGSVVERCIENFLKQDYPKNKYEIIIADDGSRDQTQQICKKYVKEKKIVYVRFKEHSELKAKIVDYVIKNVAKGDIILETDVDFVLPTNWITEMVKPFSNPQIGGVTGCVMCGNWYRNFLTRIRALEDFWWFCISMYGRYKITGTGMLYGSSKAYRKKIWELVGGHPTKTLVEDAELAVKIIERGYKIAIVKIANLAEEVENIPQYFEERKRWLDGNLSVTKCYSKELRKNKINYVWMLANFGWDGIILISISLAYFDRIFLIPIILSLFAMWVGLYGLKAKEEFYFIAIPYLLISPLLQVAVLIAILIDKLQGKTIKWTKVWHHPTNLFWPVRV